MKKLLGLFLIITAICSGCYHELETSYKLSREVDDIQKVLPVLTNMVKRIQERDMTVINIRVLSNVHHNSYLIYVEGRDNDDFIEER